MCSQERKILNGNKILRLFSSTAFVWLQHCVNSVQYQYKIINILDWALQWRHNGRGGVSNHQPHDSLLNRLFTHRSKTSKLRVTGLCAWNSPRWPLNSPHKGPVTRKMFPFDDAIMDWRYVQFMLPRCISNCCLIIKWNDDTANVSTTAHHSLEYIKMQKRQKVMLKSH